MNFQKFVYEFSETDDIRHAKVDFLLRENDFPRREHDITNKEGSIPKCENNIVGREKGIQRHK